MKSRYIYCPMTSKRIGRRLTVMDRIRRWLRGTNRADVYQVTGFFPPVFPGK